MSILAYNKAGKPIYPTCIECGKPKNNRKSRLLPLCHKCAIAKKTAPVIGGNKQCSKCGEWKALNQFYKGVGAGGRKSSCKVCSYDKEKKNAYYQAHRAGYLQQFKGYRQRFLDSIKEREKIYRETHKSQRNETVKKYRQAHPEKEREWRRAKWGRKYKDGDYVTEQEWQAILDKYGNKCLRCGNTEDITQDHVIPLFMGGRHIASNLQPLCRSCNSRKHTKIEDYR